MKELDPAKLRADFPILKRLVRGTSIAIPRYASKISKVSIGKMPRSHFEPL
mgnify:CR=1 FL=1